MDAMKMEPTGAAFLLFLSDRVVAADIAEEIRLQQPGASLLLPEDRANFMAALETLAAPAVVFVELELLGPVWDAARLRLVGRHCGIVLFGDTADELSARGEGVESAAILARPYSAADLTALVRSLPAVAGTSPAP